jgi:hypothetical protein
MKVDRSSKATGEVKRVVLVAGTSIATVVTTSRVATRTALLSTANTSMDLTGSNTIETPALIATKR